MGTSSYPCIETRPRPRLAHFQVTPEDRQRLQALVAVPLTPQKHV